MKGLEDLASALSILPKKIPHKINQVINNDKNQWFRKPLREFQKETTRITSFVYMSTCWNTLQQGMDYSLNFFGSTRKVSNVRFSLGEKYYLLDEIKEDFAESNCDALDDGIVEMFSSLASQYDSYKEKARSGKLGKTPQYWLIYLDLIYLQAMAHSAVQENDIEKLAFAWFSFLPFYFVLDKRNYARYGRFYATLFLNMEATCTGLKTLLAEMGTAVQGQVENFGCPMREVNHQ